MYELASLKEDMKKIIAKRAEDHPVQDVNVLWSIICEQLSDEIHLCRLDHGHLAIAFEDCFRELGIFDLGDGSELIRLNIEGETAFLRSKLDGFLNVCKRKSTE